MSIFKARRWKGAKWKAPLWQALGIVLCFTIVGIPFGAPMFAWAGVRYKENLEYERQSK
jgi:hypothetical protein